MASRERSRRAVELRARERLGALASDPGAARAGAGRGSAGAERQPDAERARSAEAGAGLGDTGHPGRGRSVEADLGLDDTARTGSGRFADGSSAGFGGALGGAFGAERDHRAEGEHRADVPSGAAPDVDAADLVARLRAGALGAAATAYTAAHGHPLDREDPLLDPPARRWALSRRAAIAASVAILLVVAVVVLRGWTAAPADVVPFGAHDVAVSGTGEGPGASSVTDPFAAGSGSGSIVVHVVGEVAEPGIVELAAGSRVAEAVAAAGGATPEADLGGLNLARTVEDGEQIVVPGPDEGPAGGGSAASADPRVDLNVADAATFETLPGIGPVLAERIIAWRDEHGRFSTVEELMEVSGIGPSLYGQLEGLVRV